MAMEKKTEVNEPIIEKKGDDVFLSKERIPE